MDTVNSTMSTAVLIFGRAVGFCGLHAFGPNEMQRYAGQTAVATRKCVWLGTLLTRASCAIVQTAQSKPSCVSSEKLKPRAPHALVLSCFRRYALCD